MIIDSLDVYNGVLSRLNDRHSSGDFDRYKRILKHINATPIGYTRVRFMFEHKIYYWEKDQGIIQF